MHVNSFYLIRGMVQADLFFTQTTQKKRVYAEMHRRVPLSPGNDLLEI